MSRLLDRINAAVDGLCPCGAPPADGSAYCSDDCRPTHIAADTDTRMSGDLSTPMRWRPDLVTEIDDSDLIPVDAPRTGYTGRFNATVFERRSNPNLLHLRLDDGYRLVGLDVAEIADENGIIGFEAMERVLDAWRRLERELVNPRHTEPVGDDLRADICRAFADIGRAFEVQSSRRGRPAQIRAYVAEGMRQATIAMSAFVDSIPPVMDALRDAFAAARPVVPAPPVDPRQRALAARRSRNTGPPPDRLDGRRRRR